MSTDFDIARLLELRKLTTALAGFFSRQLQEHLASLAPLLQPRTLLGDLIRFEKCSVKDQDVALQQLAKLYEPLARISALSIQNELKTPLDVYTTALDIVPATYSYTPEGSNTEITIVTPLKWVLTYKDQRPQRLRELIASHARSGGGDLQSCVLHYLVMHMLVQRRPGVAPILEALRFPVSSAPNAEFAGLPFSYVSAPLSTVRASDSVIMQSTQLSGTNTFEEVVDLDDVGRLSDPFRERVLAFVKEHGGATA